VSMDDIWAVNAIVTAADPRQSPQRMALSEAVYDTGREFNGAVPEFATSFSRPGEDWARNCFCDLTNSEVTGHVCPGATATTGERHAALTRAVMADQRAAQADAEVMALTAGYAGELGLSADIPMAKRRALAARGLSLADGSYPVETMTQLRAAAHLAASKHGNWQAAQSLIRKRARQLGVDVSTLPGFGSGAKVAASGATVALAGPQSDQDAPGAFADPIDAVAYYRQLAQQLGILACDPEDDGDPTDTAQPSKGGVKRVTDGIYGGQPGGDIITNPEYAHLFSDRGAAWSGDTSQWGQRSKGIARGPR
jgi:hypothetical protein